MTIRPAPSAKPVIQLLVLASLACCSVVAHAQMAVTDPGHTMTNKLAWVQQYKQKFDEMKKQSDQLDTQRKEMQQQYVKGMPYQGKSGYREQLRERDLNANVDEYCPAKNGLSKQSSVADVAQQQHQNCVAIVQTENSRYNAMVRILRSTGERDAELDAARAAAQKVPPDQPGQLARVNNNIAQIEARIAADVQNAKTLIDAYDAALNALNNEQVRLAGKAYQPESGLLSSVVQYGTLKAALTVARRRSR